MVDIIQISADIVGILFVLWGLWFSGVIFAQVIKLMPLFLGLAGSLSFHNNFPHNAYQGIQTWLKFAPLRFLALPFRYSGKMIAEGDLLGLITGWIAIPIAMFIFMYGIWIGFWYVSLLRLILRPFRVVYNLN